MDVSKVDYLIIGGGVAGTIAAEFIRMRDSSGTIAIVSEENEVLYSRVMLPHFLRGKIPFERLYVRKVEQYEENNIELLEGVSVDSVNTHRKKVNLSNGKEIGYEKLLIASGGKVNKLGFPGSDLKGVTYLRTIKDVQEIKGLMNRVENAVVVGGGFIGIELAQSFAQKGIKTTSIIRESYFWSRVVGENSGKLINKILEENGIKILTEKEVMEFVGKDSLSSIRLKDGTEIPAELAGIGVGIHMDLDYLKGSGIKMNKGVVTNEFLETETLDIWAAGDVAEFYDLLFEKKHQLGNWSNAVAQGKVVGSNMAAGWGKGEREKFETISAYTISIFDGSFTFLGDTSKDNDTELVERGSVEENQLGQLYVRNDRIVGASLINLNVDRVSLSKLIMNRVKIGINKEKLSEVNFDLRNLLNG